MRTLIVEDDALTQRLYHKLAADLGLEPVLCEHASAALDLFAREPAALVILDWMLPGMDGLELCRRLRALPRGGDCVIVVISARNEPAEFPRVLEAGADDYVAKVADHDVLRARLAMAARQARLLQQRLGTQEALRKSEERFEGIAQATNDAVWDWDLATNRLEWNAGILTLFGYSPDDVRPEADWRWDNIHPEDRERVVNSLRETLAGRDHLWSAEYLFCCQNGFYMMVMDRAFIVRDPAGRPLRVIGSMMDITERKHSEATIKKLAAFAELNPNPVLEFAADATLTYFNEATLKLTARLKKNHPLEILPRDIAVLVQACLASGRTDLRRETHLEGRILAWSFFPVPAINAVHCYADDITERVNLEAQLRQSQKLDSIGQLSAGVAHDFNNILTIIQGYATLLLAGKGADPKLAEPLTQIANAAERASGLTRQLLLFSRKQVIQRKHLDFGEVIANMAKMLQRILGEDIKLEVQRAERLPRVFADAGMLEQVIMNLAVNARDAMPKGGRLVIKTERAEIDADYAARRVEARPGSFVAMSVTDTGTGIPPEILPKIFEPFFTTKEVGKGTGLGLATVFGIVKQHEGWIELDSEVGRGTTFRILLPASAPTGAGESDPEAGTAVRGGNETILVTEDEPALRSLTRAALQRHGYSVLEAANGVEALGVWAAHKDKISLLLTDMVMPDGMSGSELAKKLMAQKPSLKVIYASGYSPEAGINGVELTEGVNFLPKPFQVEKLARTIRAALDAP
jgi:PAS domain S-box-containing protein